MASGFRLVDLDEKCRKAVLQCCDSLDLISFSLCSKKRLAKVRSLKLHIGQLHLTCGDISSVYFDFGWNRIQLFFREDDYDRQEEERDETPRRFKVDFIKGHRVDYSRDEEHVMRRWRKATFSGNDWLRHIMSVFNCDKIGSFYVSQSKFEIDSLVDTVRDLNIFESKFYEAISTEHTLRLLSALPCIEKLNLHMLTFDTPPEYSAILRNYQSLSVQNLTLDIMLYVNSLSLVCKGLTIKEVNRFIQLWQKGANPRLRYLHVRFYRPHGAAVLNENNVLRRVQYLRMPQEAVRKFEMAEHLLEVVGGFDIVGKTGRKATVTLDN